MVAAKVTRLAVETGQAYVAELVPLAPCLVPKSVGPWLVCELLEAGLPCWRRTLRKAPSAPAFARRNPPRGGHSHERMRGGSPQVEAKSQGLITIEKRLKLKEVGDTVGVEQSENARAERASGAILAVGKHPGVQV